MCIGGGGEGECGRLGDKKYKYSPTCLKQPCIKQAPVLCGQRPLVSVPILALSSH